MSSILGFSTEQGTDDLVTAGVIAKAQAAGVTEVVMVTHGGMNTTIGHGLGQEFVEGESGAAAIARAEAMCAVARAQGLTATPQPTSGPEGACVTAACERYTPSAVVVGTPRHRLVGDLWDTESVRAAKHHCDDVEAVHD
jgi:nucleotide-binding universal stress UspA family protein